MDKLNYETIKRYQSFTTVEEMNQAVRGFLYKYKSSLSDGAIKVLQYLWNYSVKVVGVSFSKYDTMAATVGLSRRTIIRAVKILEELTLVKKIPTSRMNGKQGVNLFVIQPFAAIDSLLVAVSPQDVTQLVTPNKAENKQSSLCENKKQNRIIVKEAKAEDTAEMDLTKAASEANANGGQKIEQKLDQKSNSQKEHVVLKPNSDQQLKQSGDQQLKQSGDQQLKANSQPTIQVKPVEWHQLDASFLPEYVNQDFIQAAKPFFHAGDIHKLWSKVQLAYRKVKLEANLDDAMDLIIADLKRTVFMYKTGKVHTSFEGYFYSVVYSTLWHRKVRENHEQWLEYVVNR